jgi:hypothetical protein
VTDVVVSVEGVQAQGRLGAAIVWGPVNDAQTPDWQNVDDTQSGDWSVVNDENTVSWTRVLT